MNNLDNLNPKEEFDRFCADEKNRADLESELFTERWAKLEKRFDAGETMEVQKAAKLVGLPFPVFRYMYGSHLADQALINSLIVRIKNGEQASLAEGADYLDMTLAEFGKLWATTISPALAAAKCKKTMN